MIASGALCLLHNQFQTVAENSGMCQLGYILYQEHNYVT